MDAISDRNFYDNPASASHQQYKMIDETPSLFTVILDVNGVEWGELEGKVAFKAVLSCILVTLNAHLALNSGNKVSLYTCNSYRHGSRRVWPRRPSAHTASTDNATGTGVTRGTTGTSGARVANRGVYGQFHKLDDSILGELERDLLEEPKTHAEIGDNPSRGTLVGAISTALGAINKYQVSETHSNMRARILVVSVSGDTTIPYIPMMNTIFAAQKMKVSMDVCKFGTKSIFLQQASDATQGVYVEVRNAEGLIQYFTSAMFIDPSLRDVVVLPTNSDIDFRASCFVTNKVIDVGYVCSVCLCILSMIPDDDQCPTCRSAFSPEASARMRRVPKVLPLHIAKKPKLDPKATAEQKSESSKGSETSG